VRRVILFVVTVLSRLDTRLSSLPRTHRPCLPSVAAWSFDRVVCVDAWDYGQAVVLFSSAKSPVPPRVCLAFPCRYSSRCVKGSLGPIYPSHTHCKGVARFIVSGISYSHSAVLMPKVARDSVSSAVCVDFRLLVSCMPLNAGSFCVFFAWLPGAVNGRFPPDVGRAVQPDGSGLPKACGQPRGQRSRGEPELGRQPSDR
jgi:hypothetical protein